MPKVTENKMCNSYCNFLYTQKKVNKIKKNNNITLKTLIKNKNSNNHIF